MGARIDPNQVASGAASAGRRGAAWAVVGWARLGSGGAPGRRGRTQTGTRRGIPSGREGQSLGRCRGFLSGAFALSLGHERAGLCMSAGGVGGLLRDSAGPGSQANGRSSGGAGAVNNAASAAHHRVKGRGGGGGGGGWCTWAQCIGWTGLRARAGAVCGCGRVRAWLSAARAGRRAGPGAQWLWGLMAGAHGPSRTLRMSQSAAAMGRRRAAAGRHGRVSSGRALAPAWRAGNVRRSNSVPWPHGRMSVLHARVAPLGGRRPQAPAGGQAGGGRKGAAAPLPEGSVGRQWGAPLGAPRKIRARCARGRRAQAAVQRAAAGSFRTGLGLQAEWVARVRVLGH